jgi:hypothetical protein
MSKRLTINIAAVSVLKIESICAEYVIKKNVYSFQRFAELYLLWE